MSRKSGGIPARCWFSFGPSKMSMHKARALLLVRRCFVLQSRITKCSGSENTSCPSLCHK
jgi:hypothetical protein